MYTEKELTSLVKKLNLSEATIFNGYCCFFKKTHILLLSTDVTESNKVLLVSNTLPKELEIHVQNLIASKANPNKVVQSYEELITSAASQADELPDVENQDKHVYLSPTDYCITNNILLKRVEHEVELEDTVVFSSNLKYIGSNISAFKSGEHTIYRGDKGILIQSVTSISKEKIDAAFASKTSYFKTSSTDLKNALLKDKSKTKNQVIKFYIEKETTETTVTTIDCRIEKLLKDQIVQLGTIKVDVRGKSEESETVSILKDLLAYALTNATLIPGTDQTVFGYTGNASPLTIGTNIVVARNLS